MRQTLPTHRALLILALLLFSMFPSRLLARSSNLIEKRKKQLREVHLRLRAAQKRLQEANRRERDISQQLHESQQSLHRVTDNLNRYSVELRRTQLNLNFTRRQLAAALAQYAGQRRLLAARLNGTSKNGKVPVLGFLLGDKSQASLLDREYYLGLVLEEDLALARAIKEQKDRIASQKALLHSQVQELYGLKEKYKGEYHVYSNITSRRQALLDEADQERRTYARRVVELQEISASLEREMARLIRREQARLRAANHAFGNVGELLWPVDTRFITSSFGWRIHPIYGRSLFHTGVDIGAGTGAPIHAAASGVVIYSGWYGGYGQAVVIDHGNGLSTLYAHCSSLHVRQGQSVVKGEVIATVGSTGNANGPHLHFEVRENGTAVDPMAKF